MLLVALFYWTAKRIGRGNVRPTWYWALCMVCVGAGAAAWMAFGLLGSEIDEKGMIHEPFGLLPIGVLLAFFGVMGAFARLIAVWIRTLCKRLS